VLDEPTTIFDSEAGMCSRTRSSITRNDRPDHTLRTSSEVREPHLRVSGNRRSFSATTTTIYGATAGRSPSPIVVRSRGGAKRPRALRKLRADVRAWSRAGNAPSPSRTLNSSCRRSGRRRRKRRQKRTGGAKRVAQLESQWEKLTEARRGLEVVGRVYRSRLSARIASMKPNM